MGTNGNGGPKNFSQAIDELEKEPAKGGDLHSRLAGEFHRLEETLNMIKPHIENLADQAGQEAKRAKDTVENEVRKNPWAALGVVGLIFFVVGFLFGHKGRK